MATDYDALRQIDTNEPGDTVQEFTAGRANARSGLVDTDEDASAAESPEFAGADSSEISGEELTMPVVPKRADEFTCTSCFLVQHPSRLARHSNGCVLCKDCA